MSHKHEISRRQFLTPYLNKPESKQQPEVSISSDQSRRKFIENLLKTGRDLAVIAALIELRRGEEIPNLVTDIRRAYILGRLRENSAVQRLLSTEKSPCKARNKLIHINPTQTNQFTAVEAGDSTGSGFYLNGVAPYPDIETYTMLLNKYLQAHHKRFPNGYFHKNDVSENQTPVIDILRQLKNVDTQQDSTLVLRAGSNNPTAYILNNRTMVRKILNDPISLDFIPFAEDMERVAYRDVNKQWLQVLGGVYEQKIRGAQWNRTIVIGARSPAQSEELAFPVPETGGVLSKGTLTVNMRDNPDGQMLVNGVINEVNNGTSEAVGKVYDLFRSVGIELSYYDPNQDNESDFFTFQHENVLGHSANGEALAGLTIIDQENLAIALLGNNPVYARS